ncbi:MAG TPA: type II toxin-antitoxin system HicA family toxin [Candidatus Brocadiia bacterium]|nr:type II toxin-antitoxin system HicA family toxin [Planctomycetota bacterium]MDO8094092.1 type II toxin-antitoxin system HicA family toxin [Candidatus Brocadiales bacterium]
MKRKEFIRQLMREGCVLLRSGAKHDIYVNPFTGKKQPVPRHTEIDDTLAKHIRKYLGLK